MKRKVFNLLNFIAVFFFFSACSQPQIPSYKTGIKDKELIFSLKEARTISEKRLIEQLKAYPVIFIGDVHNSDKVHAFVARVVAQLGKAYTIHLANEWFTPADNAKLKAYVEGTSSEDTFLKEIAWEKNIGFEFKSFKPIYQAVKETQGQMYGINLSTAERKKISLQELKEMSAPERSFYEDLDLNVEMHQQMLEPFLSFCHAPLENESDAECVNRMYRVQVAWDEKMGQESALLAKKVLKTPKDKLIVYIGALHLKSGLGANMRFARHSTKPFVTLLPNTDPQIMPGTADFAFCFVPKTQ